MKPLPRVEAVPLFPEERAALLDLLRSLTPEQWVLPTVCEGWSVKDIAAHLVADDLGRLSHERDGFSAGRFEPAGAETFEAKLLAFINHQNETWVEATHRLSPRIVIDLLDWSGRETQAYFELLDPDAPGLGVSWAGETESANWFDLAREYSERWHHQAQIREAAGAPMLYEQRLYAPVIATMVRGIPHTLRSLDASEGTHVRLVVTGLGTSEWSIVRESGKWYLTTLPWQSQSNSGSSSIRVSIGEEPTNEEQKHQDFDAFVALDPDTAWRVFTKAISYEDARQRALVVGDEQLAERVLRTVSIVA
jgi:uncharacterized protein (TIGR03083 family)